MVFRDTYKAFAAQPLLEAVAGNYVPRGASFGLGLNSCRMITHSIRNHLYGVNGRSALEGIIESKDSRYSTVSLRDSTRPAFNQRLDAQREFPINKANPNAPMQCVFMT